MLPLYLISLKNAAVMMIIWSSASRDLIANGKIDVFLNTAKMTVVCAITSLKTKDWIVLKKSRLLVLIN